MLIWEVPLACPQPRAGVSGRYGREVCIAGVSSRCGWQVWTAGVGGRCRLGLPADV